MEPSWSKIKWWPYTLNTVAGLGVVICICAMLVVHYRMHTKAEIVASERLIAASDRLATILGYHYDKCRSEIMALAGNLTALNLLSRAGMDRHPKNNLSPVWKDAIENVQRLLRDSRQGHLPNYLRIRLINEKGVSIYDSRAPDPSLLTPAIGEGVPTLTSEVNLHAEGSNVLITAAIEPEAPSTGYVAAWLNAEAVFLQLSKHPKEPGHSYSLMDNTGRILFQKSLPVQIRPSDMKNLSGLAHDTLSTLNATPAGSHGEPVAYPAMARPIARTPFRLLSILTASGSIDGHHFWHYAMIAAALSLILLFFYSMHRHINRRNSDLMSRYSESQQQYKIMVQNNEELANEILLRKRAEAELKIINENLEDIVKHRTRKLESTLDDLQTTQSQLIQSGKLASIGELSAGIAHELNQPLMVIRGNSQLMARRQERSPLGPRQLRTFFDTIERNTKRMILIINHLRSFSRQSSKDFQLVDINKVIKDAFLMIGEQMRLRSIETITNLSAGLPYIKGDPYQLEQVFLNLLTNARDAIESHQAVGERRRARKEITITTRMKNGSGDVVEILFKDTGCGIAPQDMDKIFDPFFTTKEVGKGTGLGLSISYGILKQHGGHLEFIDTTPGNTTLSVELPAQYDRRQDGQR